jgi:hypothetical protein
MTGFLSRIASTYDASKAYQVNFLERLRQSDKNKTPIYVTDIRLGFVDPFSFCHGYFTSSVKCPLCFPFENFSKLNSFDFPFGIDKLNQFSPLIILPTYTICPI